MRYELTDHEPALQSLKAKKASSAGSPEPADYALTEWHLNAELS